MLRLLKLNWEKCDRVSKRGEKMIGSQTFRRTGSTRQAHTMRTQRARGRGARQSNDSVYWLMSDLRAFAREQSRSVAETLGALPREFAEWIGEFFTPSTRAIQARVEASDLAYDLVSFIFRGSA